MNNKIVTYINCHDIYCANFKGCKCADVKEKFIPKLSIDLSPMGYRVMCNNFIVIEDHRYK